MLKSFFLFLITGLLSASVAFAESHAVIYEFYAPWCSVCRALAPKIEALEKEGHHVTRVNIDERTTLAEEYDIQGVPTVILVKNGKVEGKLIGDVSLKELKELAEKSK
ncbi:MAG: thioredoxin family protein [Gammaproteobacteria bacterium]|nr:thioredoxin family protein [Gammaproteobacteria bacterium]